MEGMSMASSRRQTTNYNHYLRVKSLDRNHYAISVTH